MTARPGPQPDPAIRYVDTSVGRLEYSWTGPPPGDAPTLVLLHEGLGCLELWREFPAALAEATGFGALTYSRAGYGRSDPVRLPRPVRYMHDEAAILGEVLASLDVREAVLVGHSDGASIAIIHAGSRPAVDVRGLVLEGAHVFAESVGLESIARVGETYRTTDLRRRLARYHENVDVAFVGWNRVWLDPEFRHWNIEEYLPAIEAPILVVQGEEDEYGTWKQVEAIRAGAGGPVVARSLEGVGHAPHAEEPDRVLAMMAEFLGRAVADDGRGDR